MLPVATVTVGLLTLTVTGVTAGGVNVATELQNYKHQEDNH